MSRPPATDRLNLAIGLPLRNRPALTNLLQQLYDPRSANFHRYLTPEQFTGKFGPTDADYQALISFAKSNNLTVTGTHANRILLDVEASVFDVEKAFHVTLYKYQHPTETRTFLAPDVEPSIDLAVPLLEIAGLNNFYLPHPALVRGTPPALGPLTEGSGTNGAFWGYDFRSAYVPGSPLTGSGQVVGLYELDGYYTNDITAYETQAGLPNVPVINVPVDNFNELPSTVVLQVEEVSLDIEMVIAMAPGLSKVLVYEGPLTGPGAYDTLNRMATDNLASQLSSSWFLHELIPAGSGPPTQDQIYMEFAAQGQSFFQAAGDADAYCPNNTEWADDP